MERAYYARTSEKETEKETQRRNGGPRRNYVGSKSSRTLWKRSVSMKNRATAIYTAKGPKAEREIHRTMDLPLTLALLSRLLFCEAPAPYVEINVFIRIVVRNACGIAVGSYISYALSLISRDTEKQNSIPFYSVSFASPLIYLKWIAYATRLHSEFIFLSIHLYVFGFPAKCLESLHSAQDP